MSERISYVLDVGADIQDVLGAAGQIQKALDGLKVPKGLNQKFISTFVSLKQAVNEFKGETDDAFESLGDARKAKAGAAKISKLFKQLRRQAEEIAINAKIDPKKFIPDEIQSKIENVERAFKDLDKAKKAVESSSDMKKAIKELKELERAAVEAEEARKKAAASVSSQKGSVTKAKGPDGKQVDTKEYIARLKEEIKLAKETGEAYEDKEIQLKKIIERTDALAEKTEKLNQANKKSEEVTRALEEQRNAIEAIKRAADAEPVEKIREALAKLKNVDISEIPTDLDEINQEFEDIVRVNMAGVVASLERMGYSVAKTGDAVKGLGDKTEDAEEKVRRLTDANREMSNLKSQVLQFFSLTNAIQIFQRVLRQAFETVKELDKAMTETAVVTDFSVGDMWDALPRYTEAANKLGTTTLGAYETMTLFYQQGLDTNAVFEIGTETMKMARIAGLDYVKATDLMTAALRGFNMELNETSAARVNDVYSELAAITAADTQEIAYAMTKTASIAKSANMEFESTAAFLAQMVETTREAPENIGTAMKTIIARFVELKKDPGMIGEVDGEVVDANKIETALRSVGIALRDAKGQFRDLDDVFLEIAESWESMDLMQQRYIATTAAGSRQQSRFIAMMSDYKRTMELYDAAVTSSGASQRQFEKTIESLESKLNLLKNAWDAFTMGVMNSSFIKAIVDILTAILSTINKITASGNSFISMIAKILLGFGSLKLGKKVFEGLTVAIKKFFSEAGKDTAESFLTNFTSVFRKGDSKSITAKIKNIFKGIWKGTGKEGDVTGIKNIGKAFTEAKKPVEAFAKGTTVATKSIGGFKGVWAGLKGVMAANPFLLATVAIGGLVAIYKTLDHFIETDKERLERYNKELDAAKEAAQKASEAYNNLDSSLASLAERQNTFDNLVTGTQEWKDELIGINDEILSIIEQHPALTKALRRGKDGGLALDAELTQEHLDLLKREEEQRVLGKALAELSVQAEIKEQAIADINDKFQSATDIEPLLKAMSEDEFDFNTLFEKYVEGERSLDDPLIDETQRATATAAVEEFKDKINSLAGDVLDGDDFFLHDLNYLRDFVGTLVDTFDIDINNIDSFDLEGAYNAYFLELSQANSEAFNAAIRQNILSGEQIFTNDLEEPIISFISSFNDNFQDLLQDKYILKDYSKLTDENYQDYIELTGSMLSIAEAKTTIAKEDIITRLKQRDLEDPLNEVLNSMADAFKELMLGLEGDKKQEFLDLISGQLTPETLRGIEESSGTTYIDKLAEYFNLNAVTLDQALNLTKEQVLELKSNVESEVAKIEGLRDQVKDDIGIDTSLSIDDIFDQISDVKIAKNLADNFLNIYRNFGERTARLVTRDTNKILENLDATGREQFLKHMSTFNFQDLSAWEDLSEVLLNLGIITEDQIPLMDKYANKMKELNHAFDIISIEQAIDNLESGAKLISEKVSKGERTFTSEEYQKWFSELPKDYFREDLEGNFVFLGGSMDSLEEAIRSNTSTLLKKGIERDQAGLNFAKELNDSFVGEGRFSKESIRKILEETGETLSEENVNRNFLEQIRTSFEGQSFIEDLVGVTLWDGAEDLLESASPERINELMSQIEPYFDLDDWEAKVAEGGKFSGEYADVFIDSFSAPFNERVKGLKELRETAEDEESEGAKAALTTMRASLLADILQAEEQSPLYEKYADAYQDYLDLTKSGSTATEDQIAAAKDLLEETEDAAIAEFLLSQEREKTAEATEAAIKAERDQIVKANKLASEMAHEGKRTFTEDEMNLIVGDNESLKKLFTYNALEDTFEYLTGPIDRLIDALAENTTATQLEAWKSAHSLISSEGNMDFTDVYGEGSRNIYEVLASNDRAQQRSFLQQYSARGGSLDFLGQGFATQGEANASLIGMDSDELSNAILQLIAFLKMEEPVDYSTPQDVFTSTPTELSRKATEMRETGDVEGARAYSNELIRQADAAEVSTTKINEYNAALEAYEGLAEDATEATKKATRQRLEEAEGILEQEIAIKKLISKMKQVSDDLRDMTEELNNLEEGSIDYANQLELMAQKMSEIAGFDLASNFFEDAVNLDLLTQALNGNQSAWEQLVINMQIAQIGSGEFAKQFGLNAGQVLLLTKLMNDTDFEVNGYADFSDIFNAFVAMGFEAETVAKMLEVLGNTNIKFKASTQKLKIIKSAIPKSGGAMRVGSGSPTSKGLQAESINYAFTYEYVDAPGSIVGSGFNNLLNTSNRAPNSFGSSNSAPRSTGGGGGSPGGGGGSGGGGDAPDPWENSLDRLYNLTQEINEVLRERNELEREYDSILEDTGTTAAEVYAHTKEHLALLEEQRKLQQKMYDERQIDMNNAIKDHSDLSSYVTFNKESGNVVIEWDKINLVTDQEMGDKITEAIGVFEEIQGQLEESKEALWEIDDSVKELILRGKEEYADMIDRITEALIQQAQDLIDNQQLLSDAQTKSDQDLITGIQNALSLQRQDRQNEKTEEELGEKQRRLMYLRQDTSGANLMQIKALEEEIAQGQESYTDQLIDQKINELQQQNDEAAVQRERQIELAQAQLDQAVENGEFYTNAEELLTSLGTNQLTNSRLIEVLKNAENFTGMSGIDKMNWLEDLENSVAAAVSFLSVNRQLEDLGIAAGTKIDFTNAAGNSLTGTVDKEGNVLGGDGKLYKDVYQGYNGNFATTTEGIKVEKPVSDKGTTATEKPPAPGKDITAIVKRGVSGAIWNGRQGWGAGAERIKKLAEVFGEGNDIQSNYVNPQKVDVSNIPSYSYEKMKAIAWKKYKTGGLADYTGPAWLDGSKSKPEMVLNARDTQNFIQLKDILANLQNNLQGGGSQGDAYYDIKIEVDEIANDYDVNKMMEKVKDTINRDSRYRNVNAVGFRKR